MRHLALFIETLLLLAVLAFVLWEFGGLKRLATPTVPPASVEQWNRLSEKLQESPRALGARLGVVRPLLNLAPAHDRPAPIV